MVVSLKGKYRIGFTLIELLVVISIIALLLSVLMPALSRAKKQANNIVCQANLKQIGTLVNSYQADNKGKVPIMLTHWARLYAQPMNKCFLSLGLWDYCSDAPKLPVYLEKDGDWGGNLNFVKDYIVKYRPKFFGCPLTRTQKEVGFTWPPSRIPIGNKNYPMVRYYNWEGYSVWSQYVVPNKKYTNHPFGAPHGYAKYGALPWWSGLDPVKGGIAILNQEKLVPAQWGINDMKKVGSAGKTTVVYCEMGQHDSNCEGQQGYIGNYGNHPKGDKGGTNALFVDSHVEWVEGTQIGWP